MFLHLVTRSRLNHVPLTRTSNGARNFKINVPQSDKYIGTNRNTFNKKAITSLWLSREWQSYIYHDPLSSVHLIRTGIT